MNRQKSDYDFHVSHLVLRRMANVKITSTLDSILLGINQ